MNTVSITWLRVRYVDLKDHKDTIYYAFSNRKVLLYIGITFRQNMKTEIDQTLKSFKERPENVTLWIGYITYTTYVRITEQIVKDVECLLIFKNKPLWNTQCKAEYTGRPDLKIISHDFPLLMHIIIAT
jgi:hypothetical protein